MVIVNLQRNITACRRRRSVYVFAQGFESPPANFINFSVDIPLLVLSKIDKQGGDICSDMD